MAWLHVCDVEVELLRMLLIRPSRCEVGVDPLECEFPHVLLATDHHPVRFVLQHLHAENLGVERGQDARVRAVEHGLLNLADHTFILHCDLRAQR